MVSLDAYSAFFNDIYVYLFSNVYCCIFREFFYSPWLVASFGVEKAPIRLDMQLAIAVGLSCIGCWRGALVEAVGAGVASSGGRGISVTVLLLAALRYRSRCGFGC